MEFTLRYLEDKYVDDTASGCESVEQRKEFLQKSSYNDATEARLSLRKQNCCNKELERFFENEENKEIGVNVENNDILIMLPLSLIHI